MTTWMNDEAIRARARENLETMKDQFAAIELAAAIVDGGILPEDLSQDQLATLLSEDTLEVVAELLREGQPLAVDTEPATPVVEVHSRTARASMRFADHLRRAVPAAGGLAAAAAIAIVAIIAIQPEQGLDWRMPSTIGAPSLVKSPAGVPPSEVLAYLSPKAGLFVIDFMRHEDGRSASLGLGQLDDGSPKPFALITFQIAGDGALDDSIDVPGGGVYAGQALLRDLLVGDATRFAATARDGRACWGVRDADGLDRINGRWDASTGSWSGAGEAAKPPAELAESHRSMLERSPFGGSESWLTD